jgi:NTE family protein
VGGCSPILPETSEARTSEVSVSPIGLALSGGGVRGLAHIGVLKVLEEAQVPIHCIAGTSMGGLLAAAWALGRSAHELEQEALRMSRLRNLIPLADPGLSQGGLLAGQKIADYLADLLGDATFEQTRIPLAVIAADLNRAETVVLREGLVRDAVRATIALPGLLAPLKRGEQVLVDGGLLLNLPAAVTRQMGAEVVVAVDIATDLESLEAFLDGLRRRFLPDALVEVVTVLWRSLLVMMHEVERRSLQEAAPDLIVRPPIPPGVTTLSGLSLTAQVIAAGEQAAREMLPDLATLTRSAFSI